MQCSISKTSLNILHTEGNDFILSATCQEGGRTEGNAKPLACIPRVQLSYAERRDSSPTVCSPGLHLFL